MSRVYEMTPKLVSTEFLQVAVLNSVPTWIFKTCHNRVLEFGYPIRLNKYILV